VPLTWRIPDIVLRFRALTQVIDQHRSEPLVS